ncbi:lipoprotein [Fictibacillus macauensis ZFHKF-1]|uniref:Lipoprotein n=1 Tax=Fictibacillus macauensis ZFHKF-1 TaxID=1196324 RepID=I8AHQ1_9BACL|nr:DUF4359 domain-containing protein [Fictibacillus macauensis]EIT85257.1 lipoprotein [Fictibacillus macauensis ZFHKF-1]
MKRKSIITGFLLSLLILMAVTNPSKTDYESWVSEEITKKEGALMSWLSKPVINSMTEKNDYLFFSVYKTKIGKNVITTYGAFNHFLWSNEK